MRLLLPAFAALSTALYARSAAAQATATRAHAVVDAPCASEDDFWQRVGRHTSLVTRASPDEAAVTLSITVRPAEEGTSGVFRVLETEDAPPSYERAVVGKSCQEVMDALSFFVALTYDPNAGAVLLAEPSAAERPVPPQRRRPPPPSRRPPGWEWALAVGATAGVAAIDEVPLGGSMLAQASRRFGAIQPAFRLSLSALTARVEASNVSARFVWLFAAPEACPMRLAAGAWSLSPCAALGVGLTLATPSGVPGGRAFTRPWLSPRVLLRNTIAVTRRLSVELSTGIDAPLLRERYVFGPIPAYETPLVIPFAMLGVSFLIGGA